MTIMKATERVLHRIPSDDNDVDGSRPSTQRPGLRKRVRFTEVVDDDDDTNNANTNTTTATDSDSNAEVCGPQQPPLSLTDELCHELWYQQDEINKMKADVRYTILHRNEIAKTADGDQLVGLHRFSPQRAQWKRSAIYYTLLAQKQQKHLQKFSTKKDDPDKLAQKVQDFVRKVSLRCTGWAREQAIKQGFKDYCAIHDPLACLFDGPENQNYNDCFFSDHAHHEDGDDVIDDDRNIATTAVNTDVVNNCNKKRKHRPGCDSDDIDADADVDVTTVVPMTTAVDDVDTTNSTGETRRNVRRRVSTKEETR
jgi:hypothetical protein